MNSRMSPGCLLALITVPGLAWGQACPAGAETGPRISNGTRVTVVGVHNDDSYSHESGLIGKEGTATDLTNDQQTCWFGGEVAFDDGSSRYFYRVAVDAGGNSGVWPVCEPGSLSAPVPNGTQTVVLGIHPDDSYFGTPQLSPGTVVTTSGLMTQSESCWLSGSVRTQDGSEYYMYKVSLGSDANLCPANAIRSAPQAGERLQVVRVHSDAADAEASALPDGLAVEAVGKMAIEDGCWLAGELLIASEGQTVLASRVALARGNGATTTCSGQNSARVGDTVRVASVGQSDPYAAVAHRVVGTEGIVRDLRPTAQGCWVAGEIQTPDGVRYRFSQATFAAPVPTDED